MADELLFAISYSKPFGENMYRKPRFLEELHAIREEMSRECDYDIDLFAEMARSGKRPHYGPARNIRGLRSRAPAPDARDEQPQSGQSND